ncbi:MAG: PilZ domain-containing protein [Candidatus Eremiobacteraeota bacterium]|nr:PilZ domain-containing protein [Candidatus Eremiobacteraeota bacterium]MCW5872492.1 PilZ domain-containing protein [Candidatus Eremiobacteraeota bacterium]
MFGFLGPEIVKFVDMREALLTFVCARAKKAGSACKVRLVLPGCKTKKVDLNLRIVTSRPSSGAKGHICVGFVIMSEEFLGELEDLLRSYAERPDLGMAARRSPRLPISLKTMGRELPGFSCVTVDISQHGVRLNCHGAMKQGQVVNLILESDVASVDNMRVRGRVVWCRENKEVKGYLVGVEFVEITPAQADALERYNKSLAGRLRGNVMHRQIADGEITVRPDGAEEEAIIKPPSVAGGPPPPPPTS